ncbi:hypothetical protein CAPTEDRAFT_205745 [Capitella teleta]|uniref:Chitin-binding type-2 domain-containing protein n=1 Tax=Capitella teleta TaxID=283909 RepID=R7U5V7_CAPTE|nr:hypothetical protein CAPTEDRAFT_205745 [Capitella teleta]|eukprot:ELT98540.1 hypothetical protein CAPTEDRAFT_205745 [Capitella teleta]
MDKPRGDSMPDPERPTNGREIVGRTSFGCENRGCCLTMEKFVAIVLVFLGLTVGGNSAQDNRCYECTSYMKQCEDEVDPTSNIVFKTACKSKCYARIGEDGAIYRGCFSYFEDATGLDFGYTGCHNQTWNNKNLVWCLCDSDLCNGQSFRRMQSKINSYSDYSPNQNYDGAEKYAEADYIHDNQDTKLMPNSYAKEGSVDDTYQEPHMKLWESGYGDAYKSYGSQESHYDTARTEQDDYNNAPYSIGQQYSRNDDVRESYGYKPERDAYVGGHVGYEQNSKLEVDEEENSSKVSPELASQIRCSKTGYYQNPHDCRQFIACLMDPHGNAPIMHLMRCPSGLVFDNRKKICLTHSSTCNTGDDYYEYEEVNNNEYELNPYANEVKSYANEVTDDLYAKNEPRDSVQLNYESKLYDSKKKVDTTGFVQSGGEDKYENQGSYVNDRQNYVNDVSYDQRYNTDYEMYEDQYDNSIYNARPQNN